MLVYEERLIAPHIDILKDELLELRIIGNRVDHPRKKSKDLADAMCGSVYNAIANTRREKVQEIEIHTWKTTKADRHEPEGKKVKPEITPDIKDYLETYRLI
jgi:hypothetical protein